MQEFIGAMHKNIGNYRKYRISRQTANGSKWTKNSNGVYLESHSQGIEWRNRHSADTDH